MRCTGDCVQGTGHRMRGKVKSGRRANKGKNDGKTCLHCDLRERAQGAREGRRGGYIQLNRSPWT